MTMQQRDSLSLVSKKKYFSATLNLSFPDVVNGFNIWEENQEDGYKETGNKFKKVAVDESITLHCGASIFNYSDQITWHKKSMPIQNDHNHFIQKSHTKYSNRISMIIKNTSYNDSGVYFCRVLVLSEDDGANYYKEGNFTLFVSGLLLLTYFLSNVFTKF